MKKLNGRKFESKDWNVQTYEEVCEILGICEAHLDDLILDSDFFKNGINKEYYTRYFVFDGFNVMIENGRNVYFHINNFMDKWELETLREHIANEMYN